MENNCNLSYIFSGISALGTLILGVLAIFGNKIRAWFFRPKLDLELKNDLPFKELIRENEGSESDPERSYQELRLKVINNGHESGRNCKIFVDVIYMKRDSTSEFYKYKEFLPREFYWCSEPKKKTIDIFPKIPTYALIAQIKEKTKVSSQSSSQTSLSDESSNCLYLMVDSLGGEGSLIKFEKGVILFPLVLYSENISAPIKKFMKIFWDGSELSDLGAAHFDMELLGEKDGNLLIRRAK